MIDVGKEIVRNVLFLIDNVFGISIKIEMVLCLYKLLFLLFLIFTCIILGENCLKKLKSKTKDQVEPEFERIIRNNNLMNIWVLGPWGSGKTKFVKTSLDSLNQEYFYVSLFGLTSRNEIIQEINEQIVQETKISLLVDLPLIGTIFRFMYQLNGLSILRNFREKYFVVIDDFERISNVDGTAEITDFGAYNDVLGVIDYIQQSIGCRVIVISTNESLEKFITEIVIPKFYPYQYQIKFNPEIIKDLPKQFFKKNNSQEIENFSGVFSEVWGERIRLDSLTNYRPIIHELSYLSDETDVRFQISYVLSRLMDCWEINMSSGSSIPFKFLVNRITKKSNDSRKYKLLKKIIEQYNFENGLPYYVQENSKERITDRLEVQEVLVLNYMRLELKSLKISNDYQFNDDEVLLLTSRDPKSDLKGRTIEDWVSENYIKFKYRHPTRTYKNIVVSGRYDKKWKNIYQNSLARYFVKDQKIDFNPTLESMIINTIKRFYFLTSDIERFIDLIDLDYVSEYLLETDNEEDLISSRILYRYLHSYYSISGNISLYLIKEYLEFTLDICIEFEDKDALFPVIVNNCESPTEFKKSDQYKFDDILLKVSQNTSFNKKYNDKKIVKEFTLYIEHALYIVKNLETTDTINGISAKEHISIFMNSNGYREFGKLRDYIENLERDSDSNKPNKRGEYIIENEYNDFGDIENSYLDYKTSLKDRYSQWKKVMETLIPETY
ncbi:AAA family ATPase [Streptococcus suis]|uniref:AAA family ATPase n=1 Tax=Streptococcus suis TaxID=1307 RepID=UPI00209C49B5|nr:AAA family ATPase [Streptococcus suis]